MERRKLLFLPDAKVLQLENNDQIYRMPFVEKKMLYEDKQLEGKDLQKLVKINSTTEKVSFRKLGVK